MLEPALKLTEGAFHTGLGMSLFGGFGDSAPDRWGRVLMRRFETAKAKEQNCAPKTLFEIDYLLGMNDEARQGDVHKITKKVILWAWFQTFVSIMSFRFHIS